MTPFERDTDNQSLARRPDSSGRPWEQVLLCLGIALSVAIQSWNPLLGTLLLGAVVRMLLDRSGSWVSGLVIATCMAVVGLVGIGMMQQPLSAFVAIPATVSALGIATLMHVHRAGVTATSVLIAAMTVLGLGVDATSVALQGSDIVTVMHGMLMETIEASAGTGIDATMLVATLEPIVTYLWPMVYVLSAMVNTLFAASGARIVATRGGMGPVRIAAFDAPLWSVGALALGIVGCGASMANIPYASVVLTCSLTVLLSVRFIFMLQGFGVLLAKLEQHRMGCFTRTLVLLFAVWIETMFFILSIVGLVDVWANFRHLPREGARPQAHT